MKKITNLNQFLVSEQPKEKTINLSDIMSAWKKYRNTCTENTYTQTSNIYSHIFNYS